MSYSFSDEESPKKAEKLKELAGEIVFCPNCGTKNDFTFASSTQTSFFCQRCSTKISDIWESFRKGKIQSMSCELCTQPTFVSLKYCISCGEIKKKAAYVRSKKIHEKITKEKGRFFTRQMKITILIGSIVTSIGLIVLISGFTSFSDPLSIIGVVLLVLGLILLSIIFPLIFYLFEIRKARI